MQSCESMEAVPVDLAFVSLLLWVVCVKGDDDDDHDDDDPSTARHPHITYHHPIIHPPVGLASSILK